VADPPYRTYVQLALKAVPNTVVVRNDGTVEKVWTGLLDGTRWSEVFAYFATARVGPLPATDALGAAANPCGPTSVNRPPQTCK